MADPFSLIIASDPQLWWWRGSANDPGHEPDCDDDCKKQKALGANGLFIAAMSTITQLGAWSAQPTLTQSSGKILAPRAVVINGDLTATGRDEELDYFKTFYNLELGLPVLPSLGNHDYKLYVNDCGKPFNTDTLPDYIAEILRLNNVDHPGDFNYCAKQLVRYMRGMLEAGAVKNFAGNLVVRYDHDSLAYSFGIDDYHFIHLNDYPSYEADLTTPVVDWLATIIKGATETLNSFPNVHLPTWDHPTWEDLLGEENIRVSSSIPWLRTELQTATAQGKKIVLFIHDCGSEWTPDKDAAFMQAVHGQNVVAIFAGHLHPHHGYWGYLDTVNSVFHGAELENKPPDYDRLEYPGIEDGYNPPGQYIPLFRSGSVDYHTFLLAEFADTYFNVGVIDTREAPRFLVDEAYAARDPVFAQYDPSDAMLLRTYPLLHYFNVEWYTPGDIVYGTPLSAMELNAAADAPATATYEPPAGTILPAGTHTLKVTFTPDDARYQAVTRTVPFTVDKAMPVITWSNPTEIVYGTALSATQLNATASVPGTFTYAPTAGTVLPAGENQNLGVTFTPSDSSNYATVQRQVQVNVLKATPKIVWANPGDIDAGTALGAAQLNAASGWSVNGQAVVVPGTLTYTPPIGTIPAVGRGQQLTVMFAPQDAANYNRADAGVVLNVLTGHPIIESVTFTPTALQANERVAVTITVRNDSIQPHATQGAGAGFEYSEGDTFGSRGNPAVNGAYRIGVDFNGSTYGVAYPYRWGFGHTLSPGEAVTVTGYIRFHNRRENGEYYAGMIAEVNHFVQEHIGTTVIQVLRP